MFGFLFFFLSLILFNFPLILHFHLIAFCLVNPSKFTPHVLVIRQVIELKSELKRRGLTVSGPKNELIERLKYYQEPKTGCRNTSFPTAGGTTRSGAKRGAFITAHSSPAGATHQILHYQTFLNLQPGDGKNSVFKCKILKKNFIASGASKYMSISLSPPLQQSLSHSHSSAVMSYLQPAPSPSQRAPETPKTPALTFWKMWSESPYSRCYSDKLTHHLTDISSTEFTMMRVL